MIDTHCHLLPALDDGPATLEDSLALARQLVAAGVQVAICTPHYSRRYPTAHAVASERFEELSRALSERGVALELRLAAEIAPAAALEADPDELDRRSFGRGHLLVELQGDTPAGFVSLLLERLAELGHVPVLAHPERCRALRSSPRLLDDARSEGALVQVVATSLAGRVGEDVARAAWTLVESGRADLLASDAHRARRGGPHLSTAIRLIARRLGPGTVRRLVHDTPATVIEAAPPAR